MTDLPPHNRAKANACGPGERELAERYHPQPLICRVVFPPEVASALMAWSAEHDVAPHIAVRDFVRARLGTESRLEPAVGVFAGMRDMLTAMEREGDR